MKNNKNTMKNHEKYHTPKKNKKSITHNWNVLHNNKKQWKLEAGGFASMPAFVTNRPNKQTNKTQTKKQQTNKQQIHKETNKQRKKQSHKQNKPKHKHFTMKNNEKQ